MADSYSSCSIKTDPDKVGNMYFRSDWEFCPEYKTGDVVSHNGILYLCIKPHAGQDPLADTKKEYWLSFGSVVSEQDTKVTRKVLDGGYASTLSDDNYTQTDQQGLIDGGSSSSRIHMPLL